MGEILTIFYAGGFVMYPLLICSIITWAVVLERGWFLYQADKNSTLLFQGASQAIEGNKRNQALDLCSHSRAPEAGFMKKLMGSSGDSPEAIQKTYMRSRLELTQEYRRYLWILGTIGNAAPFLGLFGTVVGILQAFKDIAVTGNTGFSVVAQGISEALVATASGIIVAIIAAVFFNIFQVRAASAVMKSRLGLESFIDDWEKTLQ